MFTLKLEEVPPVILRLIGGSYGYGLIHLLTPSWSVIHYSLSSPASPYHHDFKQPCIYTTPPLNCFFLIYKIHTPTLGNGPRLDNEFAMGDKA